MTATEMAYRRLGRTGLQVSAVGLGTWATVGETLDAPATDAVLGTAFDAGVNLLDTAETYADGATERALGASLRRLGRPRETYVVCSKLLYGVHGGLPSSRGLSRKHLHEGTHATLGRLGLDHLDLLLCHRPDPDTEVEETVRAMSDLVTRGDVLYWGTSQWTPAEVLAATEIAERTGGHAPVTEQRRYNLLQRDDVEGAFAAMRRATGLGLMTWSPLAYGLLAGRLSGGSSSGRLARPEYAWLLRDLFGEDLRSRQDVDAAVAALVALADQVGVPPAQIALGWVLSRAEVDSALIGASRPSHVLANAAAACWDPGPELWREVERIFAASLTTDDHVTPHETRETRERSATC